MIQWIKAWTSAWKIGTAVASGLLVLVFGAGPRTVQWIRAPSTENAVRIEAQATTIKQHDETLDTLRAYVTEVRCILRAQVQEQSPLDCLLRNGNDGER